MTSMTVEYLCGGCEAVFPVTFWPGAAARVSGPPERSSPAEPCMVEPEACPHCDAEVDLDAVEREIDEQR